MGLGQGMGLRPEGDRDGKDLETSDTDKAKQGVACSWKMPPSWTSKRGMRISTIFGANRHFPTCIKLFSQMIQGMSWDVKCSY